MKKLDSLAIFSDFANHGIGSIFINGAEGRSCQAHGDKSLLFRDPKALLFHIGVEAAVGTAGDFKTDPFLLLRNPAEGVTSSETRFSSSDNTGSRHRNSSFEGSSYHSN